MTSEKLSIFKRKLTAIFSADVKGYSRLMGQDEDTTVRTLKAYRELLANLIKKHNGRVIDSPGDNLLAEFGSVVDAVRCAVEIQEEIKERNADLPENRRMEFRIGVNLGDVIEDENRIYGDGVNIAARVEGLADGGGICISGSVYKQVKNKLTLGYEYLGEHTVKNIAEPINVYRVLIEPEAVGKVIGEKRARLKGRQRAVVAIIAMLVAAAAVVVWNFYWRSAPSKEKTASVAKTTIPLTDRASIAVLPFKNLSGDPEQEYFSDGITNDIITDLSKFRRLLVIASNTVFTYKGKVVKVKEVGQELEVRYVLEGSVQKLSNKVRINAQLIDATTGHHLWAERYERDINDLFTVQDEIVQTIVATLAIKVDAAERARAMRKDTDNLEAYDYVLRGKEFLLSGTRSTNIKAKEMFKKAIEQDSRYAAAYVGLGRSYYLSAINGWTEFPQQAIEKSLGFGQKALSMGEPDSFTHALIGSGYLRLGKYDLAISELKRAIELNPNDALSHLRLGTVMLYAGRTEEAIELLQTGLRFDPYSGYHVWHLGLAYYLKGKYEDAIRTAEQGVGIYPNNAWIHLGLAAAYAQAGRSEEAERSAEMAMKLHPFFEVESSFTLFRNPADRNKILEGLRKAGLK
jgi:adenylate cyclase